MMITFFGHKTELPEFHYLLFFQFLQLLCMKHMKQQANGRMAHTSHVFFQNLIIDTSPSNY